MLLYLVCRIYSCFCLTRSLEAISSVFPSLSTASLLVHLDVGGYVAGMRIKNGKLFLPFALEYGFGESVDNLPPLYVPRFRWWRCLNRVSDFGTVNALLQESILPHRILGWILSLWRR
ncbi:Uncharacterized protein Fot_00468 [Forsythia ovata]|uniref:Uncharacterized protein n=1 Tax=Forsythia ovata TaxID=205694 RepID=A0ABD1X1B4_9LAMI